MIFDTSVSEGGFVIDVSGELSWESGKALVERVRHALAANQREIVLKLDGVTKIDSSGLGQVISAYTIVIHAGGSVKFVFNPYVAGVIHDCHFC